MSGTNGMNKTTGVATINPPQPSQGEIMREVITGNIGNLSPVEQTQYVLQLCQSLGLNPATAPIQIITLKGKVVLYVRKDGTEQLRKRDGVSVQIVARELVEDLYVVTARATTTGGRTDESVGAVSLQGLRGEDRANALMKAETKAKRRVTLSICGLGFLDESEVVDMISDQPATPAAPPPSRPVPQLAARPAPAPVPEPESVKVMTAEQEQKIENLVKALGLSPEQVSGQLVKLFGFGNWHDLDHDQAAQVVIRMEASLAKKGGAK